MLNRSPSLKDKHEAQEEARLAELAKVEEAHQEAIDGETKVDIKKKIKK